MNNREIKISNLETLPISYIPEKMIYLPNNLLACLEFYSVEENDFQRVQIIDLESMRVLAILLPHKNFISEMALMGVEHIAITYCPVERDYDCSMHCFGVWKIDNILKGSIEPENIYEILPYSDGMTTLPNHEVVLSDIESEQIAFFSHLGKRSTFFEKNIDGSVIYHMNQQNDLIMIRNVYEKIKGIQVKIFDMKSEEVKSSFCITHGDSVHSQTSILLQDKYIALAYHQIPRDLLRRMYYRFLLPYQFGIWDLTLKQKIKVIDAKDEIIKLVAFSNDDFACLTKNGYIEYWNSAFDKYKYYIKLPIDNIYWADLICLDNDGLIANLVTLSSHAFLYIPPSITILKEHNAVLNLAVEAIAPHCQVPEIKKIVKGYLGFFKPINLKDSPAVLCDEMKRQIY